MKATIESKFRFVLALFLVSVGIAIHEFGHAREMLRFGVEVEEFSIGWPIPGIPTWKIPLPRSITPIPVVVSPILVGAATVMSDAGVKKIQTLSYAQQAIIYGEGIRYGLLYAFCFLAPLYFLVSGKKVNWKSKTLYILLGIIAVPIAAKTLFCTIIIPLLGLSLCVWIAKKDRSKKVPNSESEQDKNTGLINKARKSSKTFATTVEYGAIATMILSVGNALPIFPLDGGKIIAALLHSLSPQAELWYISFTFATLVVYMFSGWFKGIFSKVKFQKA